VGKVAPQATDEGETGERTHARHPVPSLSPGGGRKAASSLRRRRMSAKPANVLSNAPAAERDGADTEIATGQEV